MASPLSTHETYVVRKNSGGICFGTAAAEVLMS